MESDTVRSSGLTVCGWSLGSGARSMSDYLRQTGCAKSSRSLTLGKPAKNPVQDGRKSRCHPRWIPRRDNTVLCSTPFGITEVGIAAVPPGKRAARQHQAINGGGTCSSKKPETTPHVEQRRARVAIKPFGPWSLVSSIDSAEFPWSQRVLLGFMILGSRTCGSWRDRSGEAVRRRRGGTTWPSRWRSSSHTDKPEAQAKGSSIPGMTFACA